MKWLTQGHVVLTCWLQLLASKLSPLPSTGFVVAESWERILPTPDRCHTLLVSRWSQKPSKRRGTVFVFSSSSPVKKGKHSPVCSSFALWDPGSTRHGPTAYSKAFTERVHLSFPKWRASLQKTICSTCVVVSTYCYIFTPKALYLLTPRSCLALVLENNP